MSKKLFTRFLFTIVFMLVTANYALAVEVWRYNHTNVADSMMARKAAIFKEAIEQKSKGSIEVKLYGYGELGTTEQNLELCRAGGLEFTITAPAFTASFVPEMDVFQLPFLFPFQTIEGLSATKSAMNNRNAQFYKFTEDKFKEKGLFLLDFFHDGLVCWTSSTPIRKPEDFKGLKWRVMPSPMLVQTIKSLGASPTTLPFGEVYSALQLNMIDGQENPLPIINDMKWYDVQKYIIQSYPYAVWGMTMVNWKFFQKQSENVKQMIIEATNESNEWCWKEFAAETAKANLKIKQAKPEIIINSLSSAELELFKNATSKVKSQYLRKTGDNGKLVLDSLMEEIGKAIKQN